MEKESTLPVSEWHPRHNPWLIAFAVMLSTFMEVLDTSVANVALPHIAGNLSASTHEATWVLTSYLVSNAIILPATAWLGGFWGRKKLLMICIIIFTVTSALCGLASSLGLLITARVLQGLGGGALQPISQAVLLESFPKEKRGVAMAVFALGVIVAPIVGPTVGGWITDNYSWRWIFLINLPVGILAAFLTNVFVEDPPYIKHGGSHEIDYIGFTFMAVGLGLLQVVLDKGQEVDWFQATWLCWASAAVVLSLGFFIFWELRVKNPVVNLRILKDLNFSVGIVTITLIGAVLYASTALLPMFLQSLMGYSAYISGLVISPRGIGAFLTAALVGRFLNVIDARYFTALGLLLLGITCYDMGNLNLELGFVNLMWPIVGTGIGMSMIFVSLSTLSMGTLHREDIGNATGLFNLMRNIGGSIGIAMSTTMLARMAQVHQVFLVGHLTPYDPAFQQTFSNVKAFVSQFGTGMTDLAAYGFLYQELLRQSTLMAYVDNFRWMGIACIAFFPSAFLFKKVIFSKENAPAVH